MRAEAISESVLMGVRASACACTRVNKRRVRERAESVCVAQVGTDGRSRWGEKIKLEKKNKKSKIKINK